MQTNENDYQVRFRDALRLTPEQFQIGVQLMNSGRRKEAANCFLSCIKNGIQVGDSFALGAYCMFLDDNDNSALDLAQSAIESEDLTIIGNESYYHVTVNANDQLNNLDQALNHASAAVEYFRKANSPELTASFLLRKVSILKQIASPLSQDLNTADKAKVLISEAIRNLVESFSLSPPKDDDIEFLKQEVDSITRIAGRACLSFEEIGLSENPSTIHPLLERLDPNWMPGKQTEMLWNEACLARSKGDYEKAIGLFEKAVPTASEATANSRAFKMIILHQYGVSLLKHQGSENLVQAQQKPGAIYLVPKIRQLWKNALRLYNTLSREEIEELKKVLGPFDQFAASICRDFMVSGYEKGEKELAEKTMGW